MNDEIYLKNDTISLEKKEFFEKKYYINFFRVSNIQEVVIQQENAWKKQLHR